MIIEYSNFLTEDECNLLIAMGESGSLDPGRVSSGKLGYRKAQIRWFENNQFVSKIKERVSELSNTDLENQEKFHFVKYAINGEYKPHFDGKSRCKTALIYLNDGFKGGETYFPNINRTVFPEIGKLVIWDNIDSEGENDKESFHAGLPVEFGTKYIAVIWIKK
jgi:prolyl 4-hydroxylase